jgi:hypothetical protein
MRGTNERDDDVDKSRGGGAFMAWRPGKTGSVENNEAVVMTDTMYIIYSCVHFV